MRPKSPLRTRDLSRRWLIRLCAVAWLVGFRPCLALAQSATETLPAPSVASGPPSELSLEQLLTLEAQSVFGASKFLQRLSEAPSAVSIVTAEDIQRYGWRTLADVLRSVRGFYATDDRSDGYVGVRGFLRPGDYNTRILLTLDGRRLNDSFYDGAAERRSWPSTDVPSLRQWRPQPPAREAP